MFEDASEKCRTLIEPPIQAESHLFQTDWICGLIERLTALVVAPEEYPEPEPFDKYFSARLAEVLLPCSGLEHQKTAEIPAEEAGEDIPEADGDLVGEEAGQ
ncbi:hypothetical protein [Pseudomonas mandelii]|uniref:hypothetical protein n=1 Tax=Pseudomonas mandelii TaxID=75612 RepID=UPI0020A02277|nr:hypothetical protein [Pseudomonas mandelii]MCO8310803.1 hypothetical protein [Pseudomonas mandelii]